MLKFSDAGVSCWQNRGMSRLISPTNRSSSNYLNGSVNQLITIPWFSSAGIPGLKYLDEWLGSKAGESRQWDELFATRSCNWTTLITQRCAFSLLVCFFCVQWCSLFKFSRNKWRALISLQACVCSGRRRYTISTPPDEASWIISIMSASRVHTKLSCVFLFHATR